MVTLSDQTSQEIASQLWDARLKRQAIGQLSSAYPQLDLNAAYAISGLNFRRRLAAGERSIGRKIGLTSVAVQKQLGVNQPDFGYLTDAMQVADGARLARQDFLLPKVEGEVAFILGADLKRGQVTVEDVERATDSVCAAIEIIDSRIADWKIAVTDTIADNASSAAFVLAPKKLRLSEVDLAMAGMKLSINGSLQSSGMGQACLGHPLNAVAWLANAFAARGDFLKAGDIILSGAYGPVVAVQSGQHCEVEISGLGKVSCQFT